MEISFHGQGCGSVGKDTPRLKQVLVQAVWQPGYENWRFPRIFGEGFNVKKRAFFAGNKWKPFFTYEKGAAPEDENIHYKYEVVVVFEKTDPEFNTVRAKKFAVDQLRKHVLQDTFQYWKNHLTENGWETFEKKTDGALEKLSRLISDESNYAKIPEKTAGVHVHAWKV